MTKRTKKVGVTGKYGTRYGASLRKQVKKMEVCFFFGGGAFAPFLTKVDLAKRGKEGSHLANLCVYYFLIISR